MPAVEASIAVVTTTGGVQRFDRWSGTFLYAASAIALGYALARGSADQTALVSLLIAVGACLLGAVSGTSRRLESVGDRPTVLILAAGLVFQVGYLLTSPVGVDLSDPRTAAPFAFALTAATLLAGSNLSEERWLGAWQIPLLLIAELLLGAWIIKTSHYPVAPVHTVQQQAVQALIDGRNPYSAVHFPYTPLTLLLDVPAQVFTGDHRYSQLVAVSLSGGFMAWARPGRVGAITAALFLFTPRVFLILQQGWTEPFLVLGLAASMYCACRWPRAFPYVLGLFFALKTYLVLGLPAAALLLPRPFRLRDVLGLVIKALLTAALVTAPLALWDLDAFLKSAATLGLDPLSQGEALSFAGRVAQTVSGSWVPVVGALLFAGAALWRGSRTPAGFASGLALTYLGYFALHPQASFNHDYFVVGALCCAVSATGLPGEMVGIDEFNPVTMVTKLGNSLVTSWRRRR